MGKVKLDERLSAVAQFVKKGSRVADIGTDHGYLVSYLVENNIASYGIAADLREGPLNNARETVIQCGINDKVELILSDGLKNIPEGSCDTVVLAGMGGNLIADILSECEWIKSGNINIIAQPMTHAEVLRDFFVHNGFTITEEVTAADGKRLYCIMSASYMGEYTEKDISYIYLGELLRNNDSVTKAYINKMLFTLEKKYNALLSANKNDNDNLESIISEIKTKITEVYNGNS